MKDVLLPAVMVGVVLMLVGSVAYTPADQATFSAAGNSSQRGSSARVLLPVDAGANGSINFQPATIRVIIGVNNTVVWVNDDPLEHTVTSTSVPAGAEAFDSGTLSQGQTFAWTFTEPGIYRYFSPAQPAPMQGTVIVVS